MDHTESRPGGSPDFLRWGQAFLKRALNRSAPDRLTRPLSLDRPTHYARRTARLDEADPHRIEGTAPKNPGQGTEDRSPGA